MRRCSAITSAVRVLQTESRSQVVFLFLNDQSKKCSTRRMSWEAMRVWREAKRERFVFKIVVAQSENKPTSDHSMHWTIVWLKNYVWLFVVVFWPWLIIAPRWKISRGKNSEVVRLVEERLGSSRWNWKELLWDDFSFFCRWWQPLACSRRTSGLTSSLGTGGRDKEN